MRGLLQFTMDLFEGLGNEFAPPKPPAAPRPPRKAKKKVAPPAVAPLADAPPPQDAADHAGPALPTVALRDTLTLASFVHPQATRETVLGSARVAYEFKRGARTDKPSGPTTKPMVLRLPRLNS